VVEDGIEKLLQLLPGSKGIKEDEALAEVVGFLEACQPRLVRVVCCDLAFNQATSSSLVSPK
jgi:hypothetical protein